MEDKIIKQEIFIPDEILDIAISNKGSPEFKTCIDLLGDLDALIDYKENKLRPKPIKSNIKINIPENMQPKEAMKEIYQRQAEDIKQAVVAQFCNHLAEILNGKQTLEVQTIMAESVKVNEILDMIVDFVIEDAELTTQEISFVVEYMKTDVAQRVIKSGNNLQKHFLQNKEKFANMLVTPEILDKIEKIVK